MYFGPIRCRLCRWFRSLCTSPGDTRRQPERAVAVGSNKLVVAFLLSELLSVPMSCTLSSATSGRLQTTVVPRLKLYTACLQLVHLLNQYRDLSGVLVRTHAHKKKTADNKNWHEEGVCRAQGPPASGTC
jgi:hypothetical protein